MHFLLGNELYSGANYKYNWCMLCCQFFFTVKQRGFSSPKWPLTLCAYLRKSFNEPGNHTPQWSRPYQTAANRIAPQVWCEFQRALPIRFPLGFNTKREYTWFISILFCTSLTKSDDASCRALSGTVDFVVRNCLGNVDAYEIKRIKIHWTLFDKLWNFFCRWQGHL